MHEYRSIQQDFYSGNDDLPSVAMSFDGKLFEEEIDGYRTLNVSGRETLSYDIETSGSISGRDGELMLGKDLQTRTLTIQYRLEADSNHEFQLKFRKLNWLLHTLSDVPIQFRDELDITYYGQASTMESVPPESNTVISTFEIYCADPFKYEDERVFRGNLSEVILRSPYDVKPDEIEIILKSATKKITVDNITTGRHIILNGDYKINDVIKINIPENKITQNNRNIMNQLDYTESDFHRFRVKSHDQVQVTPRDSEVTLKVRGRWK